jgi:hypothetical protein
MGRITLFALLLFILLFSFEATGQNTNSNEVTFSKDVAPIVYEKCVYCHRPGEIAPFSLLTYKDARPWARSIRQSVIQKKMPPWYADPHYGTYANDRQLTESQIQTLVSWIDGGAKEGDPANMPSPPQFADGWQIGTPDLVLKMKDPYTVPAKGPIPWVNLPSQEYEFPEDVWVQAIEVRPGNRAVVHHATVQGTDGTEYLHLYSPGIEAMIWRDGYGKLIKKGAKIQFSMHYQAIGKEAIDQSSVGFVFAKKPVHTQVHTTIVSNNLMLIPPMARTHEVITAFLFNGDARIHSLRPHMHLRASRGTTTLVTTDGKRKILLHQPKWEDAWQNFYTLSSPERVHKGDFIEYVASYDNSQANPLNPDPTATVIWGQQIEDEMHCVYVTWTDDNPSNVNDNAPIQVPPNKLYTTGMVSQR